MQLRPNLAPCPARSPPWTPKWCFWSLGPVAGQLFVLPFASPQVNTGTQIDGRRGRHAKGELGVRLARLVPVFWLSSVGLSMEQHVCPPCDRVA